MRVRTRGCVRARAWVYVYVCVLCFERLCVHVKTRQTNPDDERARAHLCVFSCTRPRAHLCVCACVRECIKPNLLASVVMYSPASQPAHPPDDGRAYGLLYSNAYSFTVQSPISYKAAATHCPFHQRRVNAQRTPEPQARLMEIVLKKILVMQMRTRAITALRWN